MTCSFALVNQTFVEDRVRYLGYIKASTGLGLMLGPSLGSLIYGFFGYAITFYFFSVFIFLAIVLQTILIPNSVNKPKDEEMEEIFQTMAESENSMHDKINPSSEGSLIHSKVSEQRLSILSSH